MSFIRASCSGDISDMPCWQLVEHGVEELLLQLLHQLLEPLPGRVVHPVVLLELADAAGQIGGSCSSSCRRCCARSSRSSSRRLSPDARRLVDPAVDAFAFLLDDLVELIRDVLVDAAEVVAIELLPPALAQLLQHLAHAADVAALTVLEALLHHPRAARR